MLISSTKFNLIASSLATLQQPHPQFRKALRQYFSLFFTKKYPVYVKNNRGFQKVHRHFRQKLNVRLINSATERILMQFNSNWSWDVLHRRWAMYCERFHSSWINFKKLHPPGGHRAHRCIRNLLYCIMSPWYNTIDLKFELKDAFNRILLGSRSQCAINQ